MHLLEPKKLCLGFFAQYHTLIKIDTGGLLSTVLMSTILMQAPKFIASTEFHAATKHRGAAARVRRDAQGARIHAEQTTTKNEQHVLQHLTGCSSKQAVRAANSAAAETSAAAAITRIAIILLADFKDSIGAQTQKKNLRAYTLRKGFAHYRAQHWKSFEIFLKRSKATTPLVTRFDTSAIWEHPDLYARELLRACRHSWPTLRELQPATLAMR